MRAPEPPLPPESHQAITAVSPVWTTRQLTTSWGQASLAAASPLEALRCRGDRPRRGQGPGRRGEVGILPSARAAVSNESQRLLPSVVLNQLDLSVSWRDDVRAAFPTFFTCPPSGPARPVGLGAGRGQDTESAPHRRRPASIPCRRAHETKNAALAGMITPPRAALSKAREGRAGDSPRGPVRPMTRPSAISAPRCCPRRRNGQRDPPPSPRCVVACPPGQSESCLPAISFGGDVSHGLAEGLATNGTVRLAAIDLHDVIRGSSECGSRRERTFSRRSVERRAISSVFRFSSAMVSGSRERGIEPAESPRPPRPPRCAP